MAIDLEDHPARWRRRAGVAGPVDGRIVVIL